MKIIGVTGTSGKTTTTTLLYKIATALGYKAGLIGTVENMIAGERVLTPENMAQTTPGTIFLYKLLNKMAEHGCQYVFMEVSSHALDQDRVAGINFTGGVFTNLSQDHFDYHKNFENYFTAKRKLFRMLGSDAFALSNTDDEYGRRILEDTKAQKYTYGFTGTVDFSEKLETSLLGHFNEYNSLGAFATATLLGWDKEKVKEILKTITPPRGRFEQFKAPNGVLVIVDYAHKPDAVEKVLNAVKSTKPLGKIISLLGCGGNKDKLKRPIMGKITAHISDISIFTSDNPRDEEPEAIIEEMKKDLSVDEAQKVVSITDRHAAILEATRVAKSGDIIIAMGKGHEDYQEVKGVRTHFDDMEEFKKAFQLN